MKPLRHEFLIQTVLDAIQVMEHNSDLSPRNPLINQTLSNLVGTITDIYTRKDEQMVLNDPRIRDKRETLLGYLSQAEGEMEKYWTDSFLHRDTLTEDDLQEFWYWDNYEKLVDKEMEKLPLTEQYAATEEKNVMPFPRLPAAQDTPAITSAAFVGAGSLPLSAIIFHQKTGIPVTCIDNDPEACEKAEALFEKLGLGDVLTTELANGVNADYRSHDLVFIASLVPDDEKHNIISHIRSTDHSCAIAVRSAERLHTLLYEPFEPNSHHAGHCRQIGKTDHDADVINTTYVMIHDHQSDSAASETLKRLEL